MDIHLILASTSPRRRELIQLLNLPYTCVSADCAGTQLYSRNHARTHALCAGSYGHAGSNAHAHACSYHQYHAQSCL